MSDTAATIIKRLRADLPGELISWMPRPRSNAYKRGNQLVIAGMPFVGRHVLTARLDEVVPGRWRTTTRQQGTTTICRLELLLPVGANGELEWVWREDGAGDSQIEAQKGALTNAFKRACMAWGLGAFLAELPTPHLPCEQAGKSVRIIMSSKDIWAQVERILAAEGRRRPVDEDEEDETNEEPPRELSPRPAADPAPDRAVATSKAAHDVKSAERSVEITSAEGVVTKLPARNGMEIAEAIKMVRDIAAEPELNDQELENWWSGAQIAAKLAQFAKLAPELLITGQDGKRYHAAAEVAGTVARRAKELGNDRLARQAMIVVGAYREKDGGK